MGADAPEKSELKPEVLAKARIFVDDWGQASHSGEINMALDEGSLSTSQVEGSLATADLVYRAAREKAMGTELSLQ